MGTQRLIERVDTPSSEIKVDPAKGTIENALLCGLKSENGRDYLPESFGKGIYEGVAVNLNHSENGERTVQDCIGWITGESRDEQGRPRGTVQLIPDDPQSAKILFAAKNKPGLFGMSHVAMCDVENRDGRDVVKSVVKVESVDIVTNPATTKGFNESVKQGVSKMRLTLKTFLERYAAHLSMKKILALKHLQEMDDMGSDMQLDVEPGKDPNDDKTKDKEADDGVDAAFETAVMSVVRRAMKDGYDKDEVLSKLDQLLTSHGVATGKIEGSDMGDDDTGAEESKKRKKLAGSKDPILEAVEIVGRVGFAATRKDLEIIASAAPQFREEIAIKIKRATNKEMAKSTERTPTTAQINAEGTKTKPRWIGSKKQIA